jgi:hypothetical protein
MEGRLTSARHIEILVYVHAGGLATLVASYLARARGSGEPELSTSRCKDLDHFIREAEAFQLDHGHIQGSEFDDRLNKFRENFEQLLGNTTRFFSLFSRLGIHADENGTATAIEKCRYHRPSKVSLSLLLPCLDVSFRFRLTHIHIPYMKPL